MRLTEQSLAEVSEDQRVVDELTVNNEIKKRMDTESELNEDPEIDNGTQL